MTDVIEFDGMKTRRYLTKTIDGFLRDPPDSDFQCGFLSAVIVVYKEALGSDPDSRIEACEKLIASWSKGRRESRIIPFACPPKVDEPHND